MISEMLIWFCILVAIVILIIYTFETNDDDIY
jgi:hypothetical protein